MPPQTEQNEIVFTFHKGISVPPGEEELFGYIRYKKKAQILEICNFYATLTKHNLRLGGGNKAGNEKCAGGHGEGFKLGSLKMIETGRRVRITTGSLYLNFNIDDDSLYCRISAISPSVQARNEREAANEGSLRNRLSSRAGEDVTVMIYGVTEDDFNEWIEVSTDLVPPCLGSIIEGGSYGQIFLDEEFRGKIYLKGLRIDGGEEYIFGYNFAAARTGRDRELLTSPRRVAMMVASMWKHAIQNGRPEDVREYTKLFYDHEECSDIAFAIKYVAEDTARAMWTRQTADEPNVFFYHEDIISQSDQKTIILTNLKKRPEIVPKVLWNIFRKYNLAKTPEEERQQLFAACKLVEMAQDNALGTSVLRMFETAKLLIPWLKEIKVRIVEGGETGLDVQYDKINNILRLHNRLFDFEETHKHTVCDHWALQQEQDVQGFSCDHVVEDLFELVVHEVGAALEIHPAESKAIRQLARERIRQTPRRVNISQTPNDCELRVTWIGNESGIIAEDHASKILYVVDLHKVSTCGGKQEELLHTQPRNEDEDTASGCKCQQKTVCLDSCAAVFSDLDAHEKYFPMVARSGNDTFFACPPPEVAPRSPVSDARMTSALDVSDNAQDTPTVQSISDTSDPLVIPSRSLVDSSESSVVPRGDIGYGQHGRMHCQVVDAHSPKSIGEGHRLLAHDEEKCEILRKAYEASQRWYKTDLPEISSQLLYMSPPEKQTESSGALEDPTSLCKGLRRLLEADPKPRGTRQYITLINGLCAGADGHTMASSRKRQNNGSPVKSASPKRPCVEDAEMID